MKWHRRRSFRRVLFYSFHRVSSLCMWMFIFFFFSSNQISAYLVPCRFNLPRAFKTSSAARCNFLTYISNARDCSSGTMGRSSWKKDMTDTSWTICIENNLLHARLSLSCDRRAVAMTTAERQPNEWSWMTKRRDITVYANGKDSRESGQIIGNDCASAWDE